MISMTITPLIQFHSRTSIPNQLNKEARAATLGDTPENRRLALSGYFAAIVEMDRNIGRLLDWLGENGLRENTLVVFNADNGMNMGHHGIWGKGNGTYPAQYVRYGGQGADADFASRPRAAGPGLRQAAQPVRLHADPAWLSWIGYAFRPAASGQGFLFHTTRRIAGG